MTGAASAGNVALGAFGSSLADAIPTVTIAAITSRMNGFTVAMLALFALLRSAMSRDYVRTCTEHNWK